MLAQKLILSYGSQISIQFIQIAVSIVVARIVGPTVLGTVAFGLAFVSMFSFITLWGPAHIKLISEGEDLGKCISTFSVLKFLTTGVIFVLVIAVLVIQKYLFNYEFESPAHQYVIFILLLSTSIQQLLYIPNATFIARTEQAKQSIPEFLRIFIYQILRVIIVLLGYKAVALAFGNFVSTLLIAPFILYLFKDYPKAKFDKKLAAKYFKIAVPVMLIGMSTKLIYYLDRVVLQYFANSEQVGYYTAGYRIGGLVLMIATSVELLFFPLFSKAVSNGNFQYIKATIEKFERFSFLFIMPVVIFLSLYSDVVIRILLGTQYLPSISVMAIINVAMFLMVLNTPYGDVIIGMGLFKLAALLKLTNLVLFVISVYILLNPNIFNLGAVGVAIALFISNIFIGILFRIFAKQKCSLLNLKKNLRFILFGIIGFIGFYLLYHHFSVLYGISFKIVFVPVYFCITYLVLFFLGWINKKDLHSLKELVNTKKLGSYIRSEMRNSGRERIGSEE